MRTAPSIKYSLLDLTLGAALAALAAWITTKIKLALLTTEDFSGTVIYVDTVFGRITLHGKVRSVQEKTKEINHIGYI